MDDHNERLWETAARRWRTGNDEVSSAAGTSKQALGPMKTMEHQGALHARRLAFGASGTNDTSMIDEGRIRAETQQQVEADMVALARSATSDSEPE